MGAVRRQYTKEFKEQTVRLFTQGGVSLSQASRDLDINTNVLRRWKAELERHGDKAFPGQGVPLEQELVRLQRENEVLRQEREILKKAVRIFSQAPP
jgi:transposase